MTPGPLTSTSPSSAIRIDVPGSGHPMLPCWWAPGVGRFTHVAAEVSVRPYPSMIGMPTEANHQDSLGSRRAEPEMKNFTRPPNRSRILPNTRRSARAYCAVSALLGLSPACRTFAMRRPTANDHEAIFALAPDASDRVASTAA